MNDIDQKIDENIEKVLRAAGTSFNGQKPARKRLLRTAMRQIMSESYIAGSNDAVRVLNK